MFSSPFSVMAGIVPVLLLAVAGQAPLRGQDGPEPSKQPAASETGREMAAKELAETKSRIKKTGDHEYELGAIKFNSATREIRFPALINMSEGALEYALVHEHGKTHESLLSTAVSPMELNVAMLLTHYEPHIKEAAQYLPDPRPQTVALMNLAMEHPGANQVLLTALWKDAQGTEHSTPITRWLKLREGTPPGDDAHWTYTGSMIGQTGFAAQYDGSIIAIYFDLISLINLPVKENASDDVWAVNKTTVPPLDTPVTLVIRPKPQSPAPGSPPSQ